MSLLLIQFLVSFWMMTIIWFVQVVHYPLFAYVSPDSSTRYSEHHQFLISFLVLPAMLLELASLLWLGARYLSELWWIISLILLIVIWLSTFLIQVPCHNQLTLVYSSKVVSKLVYTNWIRTICWTAKTIIIGYSLYLLMEFQL